MSDVDIVVIVDTPYPPLPVLAEALSNHFPCDRMDLLTTARVPLIKLRDSTTKLVVDISFNQSNGPRNSETVLDLMKKYPEAKPLVFVLKYFLYFHSQNEVYLGGLGSYALTLMIVFYIQKHAESAKKVPGTDTSDGELDLGLLLRGFFHYYGFEFDYENNGISVINGGSLFLKKERGWFIPDKPYLMSIEDPCDATNDVGKLAFNIPTVAMLFRQAYEQLSLPERYPHVSFLIRILDMSPQMPNIRRNLSAPFREKKSSKSSKARKRREAKLAQNGETNPAANSVAASPESKTAAAAAATTSKKQPEDDKTNETPSEQVANVVDSSTGDNEGDKDSSVTTTTADSSKEGEESKDSKSLS